MWGQLSSVSWRMLASQHEQPVLALGCLFSMGLLSSSFLGSGQGFLRLWDPLWPLLV